MDTLPVDGKNEVDTKPRRTMNDMVLWSTFIFFIDAAFCVYKKFYELGILSFSLACSSYSFHKYHETKYVRINNFFSVCTTLYLTYQSHLGESVIFYFAEIFCLVSMTFMYTACTYCRIINYDKYHALQHLLPSIWIAIVVLSHNPLTYITSTSFGLNGETISNASCICC